MRSRYIIVVTIGAFFSLSGAGCQQHPTTTARRPKTPPPGRLIGSQDPVPLPTGWPKPLAYVPNVSFDQWQDYLNYDRLIVPYKGSEFQFDLNTLRLVSDATPDTTRILSWDRYFVLGTNGKLLDTSDTDPRSSGSPPLPAGASWLIASDANLITCFDLKKYSRQPVWSRTLQVEPAWLIVKKGMLLAQIATVPTQQVAIDLATGQIKWVFSEADTVDWRTSITSDHGTTLFVCTWKDGVPALAHLENGRIRWQTKLPGAEELTMPEGMVDRYVVATGGNEFGRGSKFYILDADTGQVILRHEFSRKTEMMHSIPYAAQWKDILAVQIDAYERIDLEKLRRKKTKQPENMLYLFRLSSFDKRFTTRPRQTLIFRPAKRKLQPPVTPSSILEKSHENRKAELPGWLKEAEADAQAAKTLLMTPDDGAAGLVADGMPNSALPRRLQGEIRLASKDYKGAAAAFRQALKINPNDSPSKAGLREIQRLQALEAKVYQKVKPLEVLAVSEFRQSGQPLVAAVVGKHVDEFPSIENPELRFFAIRKNSLRPLPWRTHLGDIPSDEPDLVGNAYLWTGDFQHTGRPQIIVRVDTPGADHIASDAYGYEIEAGLLTEILDVSVGDEAEWMLTSKDIDGNGKPEIQVINQVGDTWIAAAGPPGSWTDIYRYDGRRYVRANRRFPKQARKQLNSLLETLSEYPNDAQLLEYVGKAYADLGHSKEAERYRRRATSMR